MISVNYRRTSKGLKKLGAGARKTVDGYRALKKSK